MTDRPILFSAPMIRALLDGRKTQTRRIIDAPGIEAVIKFVKIGTNRDGAPVYEMKDAAGRHVYLPKGKHDKTPHYSPRFAKGDRLWVKCSYTCFPVYFRRIEFGNGKYAVGTDGVVYALDGQTPRACKPQTAHSGHLRLSLRHNGVKLQVFVHSLVAEAFYGKAPAGLPECRHMDSNPANNRPDNLDWGTTSQNHKDMQAVGYGIGEKCPTAKLAASDVEMIRASTDKHGAIANRLGVSRSTVSLIEAGKRWEQIERTQPPRNIPAWKPWASSIYCPRWASPLTLTVTDVRVQRLQEISKADVIAEGITERYGEPIAGVINGWHEPYAALWNAINGAGSWDANPWVAAVSFTVERRNIDSVTP